MYIVYMYTCVYKKNKIQSMRRGGRPQVEGLLKPLLGLAGRGPAERTGGLPLQPAVDAVVVPQSWVPQLTRSVLPPL